jgi:hypothetical protein
MTGLEMQSLKSCEIFIDENADWFHMGNRIFRPEVLEALYSRLARLPSGHYILEDGKEICLLDTADTPYVISRVDREDEPSGDRSLRLGLKNLSLTEALDPATLLVGKDNVLYCRVIGGRFPARFSRPAYYQIAEFVNEDSRGFYIELNGCRYYIADVEQAGHDEDKHLKQL